MPSARSPWLRFGWLVPGATGGLSARVGQPLPSLAGKQPVAPIRATAYRAPVRPPSFRFGWLALLVLAFLSRPLTGEAPSAAATGKATQEPVQYMIVVTGGELLEGAYADGHTHFLTRTLRPLGLRCVGSMSVDDKKADIQEALRFASGKASLVVVTGGLGPTDNDITRQTLSEFTGIPLREHTDVIEAMARRFNVSRDRIRPNLRRQTQVPTRGTYLKNPNGSAVGLVFELDDTVIVALPGPPRELQAMVGEELVPYLSRRFGTRLPGCSLRLRFVGIGQSGIDQTLKEHVPLAPDLSLASQFDGMRVDFTFSLSDDTPPNRGRLEQLKKKIQEHLGDYIYADGETTLEEHVVQLLKARDATLALAEVGSGGSLTAAMSTADGIQQVLLGAYVAPTDESLRQLLRVPDDTWTTGSSSARRTDLLAAAAADVTGSRWAVAVGEAQRNDRGNQYVEVVFRLPDGRSETQRVGLRGTGQSARSRLITRLLDQLRRRLR